MTRALHPLAAIALTLVGAMLAIAILAVDLTPRVQPGAQADAAALRRVRQLMHRHDLRLARPGVLYRVDLAPADLALLADQAARALGGAAQVRLGAHRLALQASLPLRLPLAPARLWLNIDAQATDGPGLPRLEQVRLGWLPLPDAMAQWLARRALGWLEGEDGGEASSAPLHTMVQEVTLQPERAQLVYRWRADAGARMLARLLPPAQQERLAAYHARLAELTRRAGAEIDLPALLTPLMALAAQRSADDATARAENRALIQVLALYVTGRSPASWLEQARRWPRPLRRSVLLAGRGDFPQHFLISALLATETGGPLADALGLAKEVDDARAGSGFSFTDIAVNRTGRRFGELAIEAPRRLQQAMAAGVPVGGLLPRVDDLAEFMPEADFVARFGGVGAPRYQQVLADIDARIASLALYR